MLHYPASLGAARSSGPTGWERLLRIPLRARGLCPRGGHVKTAASTTIAAGLPGKGTGLRDRRSFLGGAGALGIGGAAVLRTAGITGLASLAGVDGVHAQGAAPSWLDREMLAMARTEGGSLTVYSSVNEQEAFPVWAAFEQ